MKISNKKMHYISVVEVFTCIEKLMIMSDVCLIGHLIFNNLRQDCLYLLSCNCIVIFVDYSLRF